MAADKLKQTLSEKIKSFVPIQTVWAEVLEVDWENKIMTAKGIDDEEPYYNILLGLDHISVKPKIDSACIIGMIDNNPTTPFLIWADEVEEYHVKVENTEFKIKEGFLLKKENETLKALMVDLLQEIQKMKFTTYAGGPTLTLLNKPKFIDIENRFKKFLKED